MEYQRIFRFAELLTNVSKVIHSMNMYNKREINFKFFLQDKPIGLNRLQTHLEKRRAMAWFLLLYEMNFKCISNQVCL